MLLLQAGLMLQQATTMRPERSEMNYHDVQTNGPTTSTSSTSSKMRDLFGIEVNYVIWASVRICSLWFALWFLIEVKIRFTCRSKGPPCADLFDLEPADGFACRFIDFFEGARIKGIKDSAWPHGRKDLSEAQRMQIKKAATHAQRWGKLGRYESAWGTVLMLIQKVASAVVPILFGTIGRNANTGTKQLIGIGLSLLAALARIFEDVTQFSNKGPVMVDCAYRVEKLLVEYSTLTGIFGSFSLHGECEYSLHWGDVDIEVDIEDARTEADSHEDNANAPKDRNAPRKTTALKKAATDTRKKMAQGIDNMDEQLAEYRFELFNHEYKKIVEAVRNVRFRHADKSNESRDELAPSRRKASSTDDARSRPLGAAAH